MIEVTPGYTYDERRNTEYTAGGEEKNTDHTEKSFVQKRNLFRITNTSGNCFRQIYALPYQLERDEYIVQYLYNSLNYSFEKVIFIRPAYLYRG